MLAWALAVLVMAGQFAPSNTGELLVIVTDTAGLPLRGVVEIISASNRIHQRLDTDTGGRVTARRLPFGVYHRTAGVPAVHRQGRNPIRVATRASCGDDDRRTPGARDGLGLRDVDGRAANLVLRGSYDRVFQTPAFENLLLASADAAATLAENVVRLPVPPSRGNFYEAGLSKLLFKNVRVDASWFLRRMTDVADDDVLLNTGVSFPIAFHHGSIKGLEFKVDVPSWRSVTASFAYSFLTGVGDPPITGGLFPGDEAAALLSSTERFPVTQDRAIRFDRA